MPEGRDPPVTPEPIGDPSMVGRGPELALLRAVLADALGGHGRVVVVSGEAGIGKSWLLDAAAREAEERGAAPLWGRCWEEGGAPAYWPWIQVLRSYARMGLLADADTGLDARRVSSLGRLVPELGPADGGHAPRTAVPDRFALFDAVASALVAGAAREPLVLLLDDLHRADEPSLLLLRFIAGQLPAARMLVVASFRDPPSPRDPQHRLLAELTREAEHVVLGGLDDDAVAALTRNLTGIDPGPALVATLRLVTGGNPFFLDELVRSRAAIGQLDTAAPTVTDLPAGVRVVARERLGALPVEVREVVAIAAVAGGDVDVPALALAAEVAPWDLAADLERAVAAGLLRPTLGRHGRYRFAHDLVRAAAEAELPHERRRQLHHRFALALEELHRDDLDEHLSVLAHHHVASLPSGSLEDALRYVSATAERAMAQLAYEEAARQYELALAVLRRHRPTDERLRCEVLVQLGGARWRAGDTRAAREAFLAAAALAGRLGAGELLGRAAAGASVGTATQAVTGLADVRVIDVLEEALATLDTDQAPLRVRVQTRLAIELLWTDEQQRRRQLSDDAVEAARQLGDPRLLLSTLYARHWVVLGPDSLDERLALAGELLTLAASVGEPEMTFWGHHVRARALLETDDTAAADAAAAAAAAVGADELRMPLCRYQVLAFAGTRALMRGQTSETERLAADGYQIGRDTVGEDIAAAARAMHLLPVRWLQGRLDEQVVWLRELLASRPWSPTWRGALAGWFTPMGRREEAAAELERLLSRGVEALPRDGAWLAALHAAAFTCRLLDDRDRAAGLRQQLAPFADRHALVGSAGLPAPVSAALAVLSRVLGRWDDARDYLEVAARHAAATGNRPWQVVSLCEHADLLRARGRPGDAERAAALLAHAGELAARGDMTGLAGWVAELADAAEPAGDAATEPAAVAPASDAFHREGDVWLVRFRGRSMRVRDLKGLRYLAHLVERPHQEWHVLDLVAATTGTGPAPTAMLATDEIEDLRPRAEVGEPVLDGAALRSYRQRVSLLRDEVERARAAGDADGEERAHAELEQLVQALAAATGLGGRTRRMTDDAERARQAVTKAIHTALHRVKEQLPELAAHLRAAVRTGLYCSYAPDPRSPIRWEPVPPAASHDSSAAPRDWAASRSVRPNVTPQG